MNPSPSLRIAAMGDIHCTKASVGRLAPLFAEAAKETDFAVLCGDLTDFGLPEEAHILAKELEAFGSIPILAVLGNHDFESGKQEEVAQILSSAGVFMLDGDAQEIQGVAFAGVKGFGGGFADHALQPWGESGIKNFVHEALAEALKLESALAKCRSSVKVVVMHYSPIVKTIEGEPLEIFPFLGSSRLEEPIDRFGVSVVFHGHAHRGSPEGATRAGVPVFNVAVPLLRARFPDQHPFRRHTLPVVHPPESKRAEAGHVS
jgi:Icc-related predicted phosphoesterase